MPRPSPVGLRVASLAILTAALWGGNPVAVSYSIDTLPPIAVAAVRFGMATIFMLFWCRWEGCGLHLRSGQHVPAFLAGFGMFLQISLFNIGMSMSSSSHGAMLIPTYVFWVHLIEHFVTRSDVLSRKKLVGLSIATVGVLLIFWTTNRLDHSGGADPPSLAGDLILLASAVVLSIKVVYVKHALQVVESGKLIFWHDLVGVVLFMGWSLTFEEISLSGFTATTCTALVYQGVFVAGLCFAVQAVLLRHHSASQIAAFSFVTPICGVLLGVLFRGDSVSPWLLVSTACVALGIRVIHSSR
jgi:drug/metabolite transporter (DMT)-like permease